MLVDLAQVLVVRGGSVTGKGPESTRGRCNTGDCGSDGSHNDDQGHECRAAMGLGDVEKDLHEGVSGRGREEGVEGASGEEQDCAVDQAHDAVDDDTPHHCNWNVATRVGQLLGQMACGIVAWYCQSSLVSRTGAYLPQERVDGANQPNEPRDSVTLPTARVSNFLEDEGCGVLRRHDTENNENGQKASTMEKA